MIGKIARASVVLSGAILFLSASLANERKRDFVWQGWQPEERSAWYSASQGSRLLPLSWYLSLEMADSRQRFAGADNIRRFNYLVDEGEGVPQLPVGFAIDRQRSDDHLRKTRLRWYGRTSIWPWADRRAQERWLGFNCAACHTGEIHHGDTKLRIDGAPGQADFQGFIEALDLAMYATLADAQKFDRFASKVLAGLDTRGNRAMLRDALMKHYQWRRTVDIANEAPLRYGFGRLDAFGHIHNQVALFASPENPSGNPSNAPVSYPFLWDTPHHDQVQWNGAAGNERQRLGPGRYIDLSALGRNSGEVIGVFGEVVTRPVPLPGSGYSSSLFIDNLEKMEKLIEKLNAPAWPASFGPLDPAKIAAGRVLFERKCAGCHAVLDRKQSKDPRVFAIMSFFADPPASYRSRFAARRAAMSSRPAIGDLPARNVPPGTDPAMACNAFMWEANSGNLAGLGYEFLDYTGPEATKLTTQIKNREKLGVLLATLVKRSLLGQKGEIATTAGAIALNQRRPMVVHRLNESDAQPESNAAEANFRRVGERLVSTSDIAKPNYFDSQTPSQAEETPPAPLAAPAPDAGGWGPYAACMALPWAETLGYKARPLDGIWATAPYLHNGSVVSLYELLLPPAARRRAFFTGSRRFDTVNVGFVADSSPDNRFLFRSYDENGAIVWGNWNGGHDYGNAELSTADRYALIEYMKFL